MTTEQQIKDALLWVKQWVNILHPRGFPSTLKMIEGALSGKMDAQEAASEIIKATAHLAHPSLTNLRRFAQ